MSYAGVGAEAVLETAFTYFPRLLERRKQLAGTMSGGEQQMLAMSRALASDPALLLLDELSMGLAPLIVDELYETVGQIAASGVSILVHRAVRTHGAAGLRLRRRHDRGADRRHRRTGRDHGNHVRRHPRRSRMNIHKRAFLSLSAAALVGATLPLTAGGPAGAAPAAEDPPFTGFSSTAWGTPLELEIYEPTIPIPATPQAEFQFGYTAVEADTGSAKGRAAYVWPGDPIGEGFKTIAEGVGLPPQISGPSRPRATPSRSTPTSPAVLSSRTRRSSPAPSNGPAPESSRSTPRTLTTPTARPGSPRGRGRRGWWIGQRRRWAPRPAPAGSRQPRDVARDRAPSAPGRSSLPRRGSVRSPPTSPKCSTSAATSR